MAIVALAQTSGKFARRNAGISVEKPVALKFIKKFLAPISPELVAELDRTCSTGNVFIWGAKDERDRQFNKMFGNCVVLFRKGPNVYKCGQISSWGYSISLAEYLWRYDVDGWTWPNICFFKEMRDLSVPVREVNAILELNRDWNWQGLVAYGCPKANRVIEHIKPRLLPRKVWP